MNHPLSFAPARGSAPRPVVLFLLLAQVAVAGCEPEPAPVEPPPAPAETSTHALAEAPLEEEAGTDLSQQGHAFRGVLLPGSLFGGQYFRYDAFVVTAKASGPVTISSDVISVNPSGYVNGYGYPLTMASLEEGATFTFVGGDYVQNALETGTAVIQYPVVAGHQYVLVYKTFDSFTPLTYRLRLPTTLKMEGRIESLPAPVPVTGSNSGQITLDNPRPGQLGRIVEWLSSRVST